MERSAWFGGTAVTLKEQLSDARIESCLDRKRYVPESRIHELITENNIKAELNRLEIRVTTELMNFVLENAKRLFAILVYSNMTKKITGCCEHKFMDGHLPVIGPDAHNGYRFSSLSEQQPFGVSIDDASVALWEWDKADFQVDFYENQWLFVVPVFNRTRYRYKFHREHILPFVSVGTEKERSGGFSRVSPVTIHPAHQQGYSSVRYTSDALI